MSAWTWCLPPDDLKPAGSLNFSRGRGDSVLVFDFTPAAPKTLAESVAAQIGRRFDRIEELQAFLDVCGLPEELRVLVREWWRPSFRPLPRWTYRS